MKINKEGYSTIAKLGSILLAAIVVVIGIGYLCGRFGWLFWVAEGLLLLCVGQLMIFFREPNRPLIEQQGVIFSPADGKVVVVEDTYENEYLKCHCMQISVFMSTLNVHINWFPTGGKVVYFKHHQGEFLVASHPKSSDENEHTSVAIDTGSAVVMYRQVAGLIARRIVSYVTAEGQLVEQNRKSGFIKFGSRLDVFVPLGSEILVGLNDKVKGSLTPIARLTDCDTGKTGQNGQ